MSCMRHRAGEEGTKKPDPPFAEESKFVSGAGEDGVEGITVKVPPEMSLGFGAVAARAAIDIGARAMATPVIRSTCSIWAARVWPS